MVATDSPTPLTGWHQIFLATTTLCQFTATALRNAGLPIYGFHYPPHGFLFETQAIGPNLAVMISYFQNLVNPRVQNPALRQKTRMHLSRPG
jgi:hypothetical protein